MTLKQALIFQTLVSVVADTMLLPFYPQFFAEEFGNSSPEHVGFYIAACCFTVMIALPLWAKVESPMTATAGRTQASDPPLAMLTLAPMQTVVCMAL